MKLPFKRLAAFFFFLLLSVIGVFLISIKYGQMNCEQCRKKIIEEKIVKAEDGKTEKENEKEFIITYETIKAIYITSWSAGRKDLVDYVIEIASSTEINAVVIDVKDFSGYVAYDTDIPEVEKYGAEQIRIKDISSLLDKLHRRGIYVIARIAVFQDPILAKARPDLAVHSKAKLSLVSDSDFSSSSLWSDNLGLAWIDPSSKEAWEYNVTIAKDAAGQGFDELNFDYVRFPSDGNLQDMVFPLWDSTTSKSIVIKEFFKYLHEELPNKIISVDLFGLSTVSTDDLGIGQIIEDSFGYFDYVCPMVYPSHYDSGFIGYIEPAEHPYEVVKRSIETAQKRLAEHCKSCKRNTGLRPWLQDFNLRGVPYDSEKVKAEIKGVQDATGEDFKGFMLWSPWNLYTKDALEPEKPGQLQLY